MNTDYLNSSGSHIAYTDLVLAALSAVADEKRANHNREIPNVFAWVKELLDGYRDRKEGKRHDSKVPCGTCQACCFHPRVDIESSEEHFDAMQAVKDDRGWFIPKRADGGCIHLTASGCGIYEQRPVCCRAYDCRIFSVAGVSGIRGMDIPIWKVIPANIAELFYVMWCRRVVHSLHLANKKFDADQMTGAAISSAWVVLPIITKRLESVDAEQQAAIVACHRRVFDQLTELQFAANEEKFVAAEPTFEFLTKSDWAKILKISIPIIHAALGIMKEAA